MTATTTILRWDRYDTADGYGGLVYDPAVNNYDGKGIYFDTGDCATKSEVRREIGMWFDEQGYDYNFELEGYVKEASA